MARHFHGSPSNAAARRRHLVLHQRRRPNDRTADAAYTRLLPKQRLGSLDFVSFDTILKDHYTLDDVTELALSDNPAFRLFQRRA